MSGKGIRQGRSGEGRREDERRGQKRRGEEKRIRQESQKQEPAETLGPSGAPLKHRDPTMEKGSRVRGRIACWLLIGAELLQAWKGKGQEASVCQKYFHSGNVSNLRFPPGSSSVFLAQTVNFSHWGKFIFFMEGLRFLVFLKGLCSFYMLFLNTLSLLFHIKLTLSHICKIKMFITGYI